MAPNSPSLFANRGVVLKALDQNWQVPAADRKRILAGNLEPIKVENQPPVKEGQNFILSWLRPKAYADPDLGRLQAPPKPLFWITVTEVRRRAKGGWSIIFEVHDNRDPVRWLHLDNSGLDGPERVDKATEKAFSKAARERERQAGEELVLAALEVRQVLRERVSSRAEFRSIAGLSIRRLDKEIEKLINHTRRKAA